MATIRLNNVTKEFGVPVGSSKGSVIPWMGSSRPEVREGEDEAPDRVLALDHVDLTVPDGKTMAVVGPSGCGKSTLLRVVSGLEADHSGDLFYDDQNMMDVPPRDRFIGMVFQNYALYPHFEGHGNLSFFFRMRKAPDEETEERIRITSEIMGIGFNSLLQRKPGTLSGGQQQRVAIARAIVRRPRVFLFDEPLSNLDAKLRSKTRVEIKRLLRRFSITALYVTHDQTEAMALGDLVAVMRAGRIEQVGPFDEVRRQPANTYVAGFLGTPPMSLLPGAVVDQGGIVAGQGLRFVPQASRLEALRSGQRVTVGIPAESTRVVVDEGLSEADEGGSSSPANAWLGTVESVEPDYGRQIQFIGFRSGEHSLLAQADVRERIALGERISVQFEDSGLHFFDDESGKRIA
ncbi:MAG: ABC transporter ATP-binding protein [Caldilineaceae bacterium SB0664_bin_27]|uniref:ABC transporter ATP-binding protein n=1 Tax=Caldilineaceae bacterium SB0664_bin_27 TaxID=2605260 RepID=A0A6B0YRX3_9CHLR|nr:ABC transporter ATP-binding protein [Caldilineaceae bacterium SB0664_bin_27]